MNAFSEFETLATPTECCQTNGFGEFPASQEPGAKGALAETHCDLIHSGI